MKFGIKPVTMLAVVAAVIAACGPIAPEKPAAPVVAPALSEVDQAIAAFARLSEVDQALATFVRGDFVTALKVLRTQTRYYGRDGKMRDYITFHRQAAEEGDADAQAILGVMYATGQDVPQDYVQAHKWFNLAAAQGKVSAAEARGRIGAKMTPAQIAEAQRLASAWKPTK